MKKPALNDVPISEVLKQRWSPVAFADKPLEPAVLTAIFEAARWSPSCFNEQPWSFVLAQRHEAPEDFARLLACLAPANQRWAAAAPLLGFSIAKLKFEQSGKLNAWAQHDVGQAMAYLTVEAGGRGLFVHQMGGFDAPAAVKTLGLPDTHAVVSAFVVGEGVEEAQIPEALRERELSPRARKPRSSFLFQGRFAA